MASIAFDFACNSEAAFFGGRKTHGPIGYVTLLGGLGLGAPLRQDLMVSVPWNAGGRPAFTGLRCVTSGASGLSSAVTGVIERFSWAGGAGDPISLVFYVSQQNATQIKAVQQSALRSTAVKQLAWWIGAYDQEARQWFEQAYPIHSSVAAVVAGGAHPSLDVDLAPTSVKDGIDVNVCKIGLAVVPSPNQANVLRFAASSNKSVLKAWGLVVGQLAAATMAT